MPEPAAPSKPPRRLWLFAPYVAVALLAVAGAAGWFAAKAQVEARLDAAAQGLRLRGYDVSWSGRRVDGFPFRLDLTLDNPRIADRAGWALSAPRLEGEAEAYDPRRWIFAAPAGFTLTRPDKGPLQVTGQAVRASVSGLGSAAPRLSFQGLKLAFTPVPGAAPALIGAADLLELHLQPGPDDQAALLLRLERSVAPAGPDALALTWTARLSHVSQLSGPDWPSAVRRWTGAGGAMTVDQADLTLGGLRVGAGGGALSVGPDGRLQGAVPVTAGAGGALTALRFKDGRTRLGPLVLGPAPKVF